MFRAFCTAFHRPRFFSGVGYSPVPVAWSVGSVWVYSPLSFIQLRVAHAGAAAVQCALKIHSIQPTCLPDASTAIPPPTQHFAERFVVVAGSQRPSGKAWQISDQGRLIDTLGRVTLGHLGGAGYRVVRINGKSHQVHRLVAETFLNDQLARLLRETSGLTARDVHVDHIDGDRENNRVDNLQWLTVKQHARKTAACLQRPRNRNASRRPVNMQCVCTGHILHFDSLKDCAAATCLGWRGVLFCFRKGRPVWIHGRQYIRLSGCGYEPNLPGESFRSLRFLYDPALPPPERYPMVSNLGRVRHANGRVTWGVTVSNRGETKRGARAGYRKVSLAGKQRFVHRLVAEAFLGEEKRKLLAAGHPEATLQVDHMDSDPSNNAVTNLQWVTPAMHGPLTAARLRGLRTSMGPGRRTQEGTGS